MGIVLADYPDRPNESDHRPRPCRRQARVRGDDADEEDRRRRDRGGGARLGRVIGHEHPQHVDPTKMGGRAVSCDECHSRPFRRVMPVAIRLHHLSGHHWPKVTMAKKVTPKKATNPKPAKPKTTPAPTKSTTMTLKDTLRELESLGNAGVRAQNAKGGAWGPGAG